VPDFAYSTDTTLTPSCDGLQHRRPSPSCSTPPRFAAGCATETNLFFSARTYDTMISIPTSFRLYNSIPRSYHRSQFLISAPISEVM
jgi:hypothetical protein